MKRKILLPVILCILMTSVLLLVSCGDNSKAGSDETATSSGELSSEAAFSETTAVIETTPDGGTVEQDSEGNKITKNNEGKITKVEDKNGNQISITQYLTTHTWVENTGANDSGSADRTESSSSKAPDNSGDNVSDQPTEAMDSDKEGEIPVVIATVPDEDDMIVLPDL